MNEAALAGISDFEEFLDKKVVILLYDGKYIYGCLRSFDQYNSLTIENAIERQFAEKCYSEINHGVCIVRGENVVIISICGEFCMRGFEKMMYEDLVKMIDGNREKGCVDGLDESVLKLNI